MRHSCYLDDHGRTILDTMSIERRGSLLFVFINGRPLTELQVDRRVSDGKIYLPVRADRGRYQVDEQGLEAFEPSEEMRESTRVGVSRLLLLLVIITPRLPRNTPLNLVLPTDNNALLAR